MPVIPAFWEVEAERCKVQGHPCSHSESEVGLNYMRLYFKGEGTDV